MKSTPHLLTTGLLALTLLASGCGGTTQPNDGDDTNGGTGSGNTGGGNNNNNDDTGNDDFGNNNQPTLGSNNDSGAFQAGEISIPNASLQAGQSTDLTVRIRNTDGNNQNQVSDVFFSSPCASSGQSDIAPAVVAAESGTATATYTALGCTGSDTVTAQTSINGNTLTATGEIQAEAAEFGAISFESVSEELIGLQGTGALPEQSTVQFRVTNSAGGPIPNQTVNFSLNTQVGGLSLSNESSTTNADGLATTTVTSGTVATSVRVTARTTGSSGESQSAQSSQLAVTTGLPDNDSFSLSAETLNPEGLQFDGVEIAVTIRAADRFNNPVPDGTAVTFTTEGGAIPGSCTTSEGACSVTFRTQDPRPDDGRATILATAIGEESFSDTSPSNGRFDPGEFDLSQDLPEAFVDYDEDGTRDSNEPYLDFNNNGSYDAGDNEFTGIRCTGEDTSAIECTTNSLNVREQVVIVFSGSVFDIAFEPSTIDLSDGPVTVDVSIASSNGQIPPNGTTISANTTLGSISGPTTVTVRNTAQQGPYVESFEILPADISSPQTGTFSVTVTTPRDIVSRDSAPVTQNP